MKQSINFSQFCDAFHNHGRTEQFSYEAKGIIFEYLEEYEESTGEEIELDVIAICCDYSEDHYMDIANNYSIDITEADGDSEEEFEIVLNYLNDNTQVLGCNGEDIVYQQF
jgi:hypothetical protein